MILACMLIFEVMVVLGLPHSEMTHCLRPPSEMVQGGLQQLLNVELIKMEMKSEGK